MGLAVALMVLEAGGSVVLAGNKKDKAEAVQKELSLLGPVAVIAANLMTEEGMETIRQEINANHRDISLRRQCCRDFHAQRLHRALLCR